MSGALQAVFQNLRSFGLSIGDAYQGGFYVGQISTAGNGIADYNIVVGPLSSAQATGLQWKNALTATPGADSVINGPQNTADITADGNSTVYPAAWFCKNLSVGGFSDWYMPASHELEICYYNLKPTTAGNNTSYGANNNAVPIRNSNYTQFIPAQTGAVAFQTGNSQAFSSAYPQYWSSTEASATNAYRQYFGNGFTNQGGKYYYNTTVRAIRRVAV